MHVTARCSHEDCRETYKVPEEQIGRKAKCLKCSRYFVLAAETGVPKNTPRNSDSPSSELAPGTEFGRYRIEKCLGSGGMGTVYRALDTKLDRRVALKIPQFDDDGKSDWLARFQREAKVAGGFEHPNICPIYDFGEIDGRHYICMAYIEGQPLSHLIAGRPMAPAKAAAIIRKLALAMQAAHDRSIVHRDLKPDNVMVRPSSDLVIMDFGLARRETGDDARLTKAGDQLGTPLYMSPEQVEDSKTAGPASDQYSLGVMLYEMLAGQPPFQASSPWEVFAKILKHEPPPLRDYQKDLDWGMIEICKKAMAKQPEWRYASCADFAKNLHQWLSANKLQNQTEQKSAAPAASPKQPVGESKVPATTPKQPEVQSFAPTPPQQRFSPMLIGLVGVLVLALSIILWQITR